MLARASRTASLAGSRRWRSRWRPRSSRPPRRSTAGHRRGARWVGELYLEIHRGTYTSQAAMKQGNRRSEHLLREAELWSATAAARGPPAYPSEELAELWRIVLLHQFHDILPGSSIAWVHREARATYAEAAAQGLEKTHDRCRSRRVGRRGRQRWSSTRVRWRGDGCACVGGSAGSRLDRPLAALHVDQRRTAPRERAPPRRARRRAGSSGACSTRRTTARCCRPAARRTCCSCTPTTP